MEQCSGYNNVYSSFPQVRLVVRPGALEAAERRLAVVDEREEADQVVLRAAV